MLLLRRPPIATRTDTLLPYTRLVRSHPDLNLEATYGRRQDDENLDASLYYRLGPKTTLTASYREALETSQQRAISNLGNLIIDPDTGELIDEDTSQPFDEIGRAHV